MRPGCSGGFGAGSGPITPKTSPKKRCSSRSKAPGGSAIRDALPARTNGRFEAATFLGPAVRAGKAWAQQRVVAVLDRIENDNQAVGRVTFGVSYHLELLSLLFDFDAASAERRAGSLLELIPPGRDRDCSKRGAVLVFLLRCNAEVFAPRVVAAFREQFRRGDQATFVGPLLACPPHLATDTVREALVDARWL
ncbi:MAG: hypothetical protein ABIP94_19790, partial [Planctomycetota bacterium]